MPRPKRPFSGNTEINTMSAKERVDVDNRLGAKEARDRRRSRRLFHTPKNGHSDPLTVLFVLDMLLWLKQDIELRANPLAEALNLEFPQFIWDPVTVGKVLADLHVAFEDKLGEKRGLMWAGIDQKGRFYTMNRTAEVMVVAKALRRDLVRLADLEIAVRATGPATDFGGSPLYECPSVAIGEIPS